MGSAALPAESMARADDGEKELNQLRTPARSKQIGCEE